MYILFVNTSKTNQQKKQKTFKNSPSTFLVLLTVFNTMSVKTVGGLLLWRTPYIHGVACKMDVSLLRQPATVCCTRE